jgi:sugar lactone lactonase YvrE
MKAFEVVSGNVRNILGEGVVWDAESGSLLWTDIERSELWQLDSAGRIKAVKAPERVGCFAPCETGGLVVAFASGFAFWEPGTGRRKDIAPFEAHLPSTRLNDGGTDRQGRFLAGGMDERDGHPISSLCRLDPDLSVHTLLTDISCSNSLCFSPNGMVMYFADTPKGVIWRFDYDLDSGIPSGQKVFATFEDQPGLPDGSCVDVDGCLWNAQWNGRRIVRYTPSGRIDRLIELPVRNPTCVAFGGAGLDVLYVSTARYLMNPAELEAEPLAGALFAIVPGAIGLPSKKFAPGTSPFSS